MPESPSSSAQAARRAVAERLRDVRLDAGISKRELAVQCAWHESKSSRVESAATRPSDADIRAWCAACGADDQAADIVAASRTADSMYQTWKRVHRSGMRRSQEARLPLYERSLNIRVYCSNVVPGLLQTYDYAAALLTLIGRVGGAFTDPEEGARARLAQFDRAIRGGRRLTFVIEEDVLHHRIGTADAMAGQLGHLLHVMTLPSVSLGIIPRGAERTMWPIETFMAFDERLVEVELRTAKVSVTTASEVDAYLTSFSLLSDMAVHGAQARGLIRAAVDALG